MIQITIIIILFVVVLIGFTAMLKHTNRSKDYILIPKKIKLSELKSQLTKLKNRDTTYPFIGITSNGTDCIYFTYKNGSFNIEFEAIVMIISVF